MFFGEDWGRHNFTGQYLAEALAARGHRILWVNGLGLRTPSLTAADARRALKKLRTRLAENAAGTPADAPSPPGVTVTAPLVLPFHGSSLVRRLNRGHLARALAARMRKLGVVDPVVIAGIPSAADVVDRLGAREIVYYCADDYAELPGVKRAVIEPLEAALLAKAGLVLAASRALADRLVSRHRNVRYFPHGVHVERFARAVNAAGELPPDLPKPDRPMAGFVGLVGEHVDLELLARVARAVPEAWVVVIGPIEPPVTALPREPNLVHLGPKPHDALPEYLARFRVGLIPFRFTRRIAYANPTKLREYLAAGCVVVTNAAAETGDYREGVRVETDPDRFAAAVRETLLGAPPDRAAVARLTAGDSWAARAARLLELLA